MNATECKSDSTNDLKKMDCEYVPCLYERPFLIGKREKKMIDQGGRWKPRIILSALMYLSAIAVFYLGIDIFEPYIHNAEPYKYAVFVLASLVFWPFIILYDSELFYRTCEKLHCLLTPSGKTLDWYTESAKRYFCLFSKNEPPAWGAIIINATCSVFVVLIYAIKLWAPDFMPSITGTPWLIIVCVAVCSLTILLQSRSRYLLSTMFTICCGLTYYVYLTVYSANELTPLFVDSFALGNLILIGLVCIVFFMAGSSIYPMLGLFKTFFLSNFESKISYPINEIAYSLDIIQAIKKYFLHLTGINLFAFFQLLGTVYFLGILNTDSILTKVLFVLGSFFPVVMYFAASVLFKKLCHKIYILQVKDLDGRIYQGIQQEDLNFDELQTLVAVKEMYANEFEEHADMNKEVLVAMFSPIATALVAVLFPAANIL